MDLQTFLDEGEKYFLPNLSLDFVIIGYEDSQLKCLLLKNKQNWFLPGGFVRRDQSIKEAVSEIIGTRTQIENPHFEFLNVFGKVDRTFSNNWKDFIESNGYTWDESFWINDRFVSLSYYALVDINKTNPTLSFFDESYDWFSVNQLPEMGLDHKEIVIEAKMKLQKDIQNNLVSHNLLPNEFTMPQLHQLYQDILEEKIDRSRFQKKMLASNLYERLPELQKDTPGRNPYLYRIKAKPNL